MQDTGENLEFITSTSVAASLQNQSIVHPVRQNFLINLVFDFPFVFKSWLRLMVPRSVKLLISFRQSSFEFLLLLGTLEPPPPHPVFAFLQELLILLFKFGPFRLGIGVICWWHLLLSLRSRWAWYFERILGCRWDAFFVQLLFRSKHLINFKIIQANVVI